MKNKTIDVGIVTELYRYPVKSFAGEKIGQVHVGWYGLEADRRFAFVKTGNTTDFPWLTARDVPQMLLYRPCIVSLDSTGESVVHVNTPKGAEIDLASEHLRSELECTYGAPVHLMKIANGAFDSMAISLVSEQSVASISEAIGHDLDRQRFRPNIVVSAFDEQPFAEDNWMGGLLTFGNRTDSLRVKIQQKTSRCMVVNLDHDTGRQNAKVLKHIVTERSGLSGIYGATERPGTVEIGDVILLTKPD